MEIQHSEKNKKGLFYILEDGKRIAEMTYSRVGEQLITIDHTQVSESLKGQGVGLSLVMKAVEYARDKNQKIIPQCSYTKSVFDKREDIKDVLYS